MAKHVMKPVPVPAANGNGDPVDCASMSNKCLQVTNGGTAAAPGSAFNASLQVQGRMKPGEEWTNDGSAITTAGAVELAKAWAEIRVVVSSYVAGTPKAFLGGYGSLS